MPCSARSLIQSVPALFKELIFDDRGFCVEARLILSRMVWDFDLEMIDPKDWDRMDQNAYLVFGPKALMAKLKEKAWHRLTLAQSCC